MGQRGAALALLTVLAAGCADAEQVDRAAPPPTQDAPVERTPVEATPSRGAISAEQASRAGADASASCTGSDVLTAVPLALDEGSPAPTVLAGYVTDAEGFASWSEEFTGGRTVSGDPTPFGQGAFVICWLSGQFAKDESAGAMPETPTFLLRAVQLGSGVSGMRYESRGYRTVPVLAPPAPVAPSVVAALGVLQMVVHPQPEGVTVSSRRAG